MLPSRRIRRLGAPLVSAAIAAAGLASPAAAKPKLPLERVSCGETITESVRIGNNLACAGDGLSVGANNITIDLNGHLLRGDSGPSLESDFGVADNFSASRVTIKNGVIMDFDHGVQFEGTKRSVVKGLTIVRSEFLAVNLINGAARNTVSGNTVTGGPAPDTGIISVTNAGSEQNVIERNRLVRSGIRVLATGKNTIRNNTIDASPGAAISLSAAGENTVLANRMTGGAVGVNLTDAETDGNTVSANTVSGTFSHGYLVQFGADENAFSGNSARGAAGSGFYVVGNENTFTEDTATGNVDDGINADVMADLNVIRKGSYVSNGDSGIESAAAPLSLIKNKVNFNGYLNGIDAGTGTGLETTSASGSGNIAKGNSEDTQCDQPALCVVQAAPNPPLLTCGTPLATSFTLRHPLDCGSGDAVVIGAPGIEVDLGLQHVSGGSGGGDAAVENSGFHGDVTVNGGILQLSGRGVLLDGADGNVLEDVIVTDMSGNGVELDDADGNTLRRVKLAGSSLGVFFGNGSDGNRVLDSSLEGTSTGVILSSGKGGALKRNTVIGAPSIGIAISLTGAAAASEGTPIEGNKVIGGLGAGLFVINASFNTVSGNTVRGNGSDGVNLQGGAGAMTDNVVTGNVVSGNAGDGVDLTTGLVTGPDDTLLRENVLNGNSLRGAALTTATDTRVIANTLTGNGSHGLEIPALAAVALVKSNVAKRNGHLNDDADTTGLGFNAPVGTPGSKNVAAGNDDPAQCAPASLC